MTTDTKKYRILHRRLISYSLLVASIVFVILGIMRGEARTVLQKAVIICLECIGIG